MASQKHHSAAWTLVERQHGVVTGAQLRELGYSAPAIKHRAAAGRLHRVHRGVYAVGRPQLSYEGTLMAAVLACGPTAMLSHETAAMVWGIVRRRDFEIHLSVLDGVIHRRPGIVVHRPKRLTASDRRQLHGLPLTCPVTTLIELATRVDRGALEAAINEADKRDLVDPEALRAALEARAARPGTAILRTTLDHRTFTLTDSGLERRFLPIARKAGLRKPLTGKRLNGFKVDFYWPDLGLVVETDGLRYHRTAGQQARDHVRDQTHFAAGLTPLRFTHAQVRFEPAYVEATLAAAAKRLSQPG